MSPSERDRSPEVPEEELAEERESEKDPDEDGTPRTKPVTPPRIPIDAPEADALEQSIPADLEDEEDR